jgi:hypothetical protein
MTGPQLTRAVILAALSDAAQARRERLTGYCRDCASAGDGQRCADHATDLRAAQTYDRVHDQLLGTEPVHLTDAPWDAREAPPARSRWPWRSS